MTPLPFSRTPLSVRIRENWPAWAVFALILALCLVAGSDWAGR